MTYKGVVFNEMKGVYSSPDSVFYRTSELPEAVHECVHDAWRG
jgi:Zn-dependent M16 (insulinase) family peptidase